MRLGEHILDFFLSVVIDTERDASSETMSSDDENNCNKANVGLSTIKSGESTSPEATAPELTGKVRELLGVEKRLQKDQAFNFHPDLASCWKEIITNGIDPKVKKSFEEKYPDKGNCPLKAPVLNPELIPLLQKTAKSRDKYLSISQGLCGRGLVALGKSICAILNDEDEPLEKDTLLEWLCDASSMFCDVLSQMSKTRKFQIYQQVDEKRKAILQESTTDEFLFGQELGKRIKTASAVEKVGLSLKTPAEKKFSGKPRQFLNWRGSSSAQGGHSQTSHTQYNTRPYQRFNRGRSTFHRTQGRPKQSTESDK